MMQKSLGWLRFQPPLKSSVIFMFVAPTSFLIGSATASKSFDMESVSDRTITTRSPQSRVDKVKVNLHDLKDNSEATQDDTNELAGEIKCSCPPQPSLFSLWRLSFAAGIQIEQDILRWISPPDPSVNYNIARMAYQEGTTAWFFEGSIFKEWESKGSILWIHGGRMFFLSFSA